MKSGVTLAHFQSLGKRPRFIEVLKILQIDGEMRSEHSRIILDEIVSRPVAFETSSLLSKEKTCSLVTGEN